MKKIGNLLILALLTIGMGLASCVEDDNPVTPDDSQATIERVKELKSKLQNSYLHYPIIANDMMCGAFSFNLLEDGKASKMGMVTIPDWETLSKSEEGKVDVKVDSCDITWDVVPNYQGFAGDGITGDALRITMKGEQGQTHDVYYMIGKLDADSVKLLIPSEYGMQDLSMWRFENPEYLCISEMSSAITLVSGFMFGDMMAYAKEHFEKLSGRTDEDRMAFLKESGLDKLTDWVYDFDSMGASTRKVARSLSRQTNVAATRASALATARAEGEPDYPNWMARISNNVKLRDLVIPGSHDATTYGINSYLSSFGQTQPLNLRQQWDCGARAFDLRVRYEKGNVRLFHNMIPCNMTLEYVASELNDLVKTHPSEGAIVIVKGEGNDAENGDIQKIKSVLALAYPDLAKGIDQLYSSSDLDEPYTILRSSGILRDYCDLAEYHPDMTMGDLRGKILVIFRSDKDKSLTSAGYASGWDDKDRTLSRYNGTGSVVLRVQDNYGQGGDEGSSTYLAKKVSDFNKLWDASEKAADKPTWYVNCPSGYVWDLEGVIPNYYSMAQSCYPQFVKKIASHMGRGIVLQDFTGVNSGTRNYEDIIKTILVLRPTFGSLGEMFEKGFEKLKDFAKKAVDTIVDTWDDIKKGAEDVWNTITDWFSARSYTPRGKLIPASTRADGIYDLRGDELVKACIYNNYYYGNRSDLAVGDLYYSDGTHSPVLLPNKTPIGVVAYVDNPNTTADDEIVEKGNGGGHGLVLCLKNAASNVAWSTNSEFGVSKFSGQQRVTTTEGLTRTTNVSGYRNTATLTANADKYPAAAKAKDYKGLAAPAGTTGWFLPSAQQWVKMMTGLGGLDESAIILGSSFGKNTAVGKWEAALKKAGTGNYDSMTPNLFYLTSSECTAKVCITLNVHTTGYVDNFVFRRDYKNFASESFRVRPILAF